MSRQSRYVVLAIVWSLSLASRTALYGEELAFESYDARLASLEAELAALRSTASTAGSGGGESCCAPDIDSCRIVPPARCAGLIGGFDLVMARPHSSLGVFGPGFDDPHFDYEATPRIWLGWQGEGGLGFRARYWEFDQVEFGAAAVPGQSQSLAYDTYVIDLEAIDTMQLNSVWLVTLSAGFRYVDFTETRQIASEQGVTSLAFDGDCFGATIGGEVRRPLWACLVGFASARGSILFGDQSVLTGPIVVDEITDNVYSITELALGIDWTRQTSSGAEFYARVGYETQYWEDFSPLASTGFEGFVLGAGIRR